MDGLQDQQSWLGGLTPRRFLATHWQKQPLFIRGAWPGFRGLLTLPQLLAAACRDDVRSRVVIRQQPAVARRAWPVYASASCAVCRRVAGPCWCTT